MPILKTIICDVCGLSQIEPETGDGFPRWGQVNGIKLDGVDNPMVCPDHLIQVAELLNDLKHGEK